MNLFSSQITKSLGRSVPLVALLAFPSLAQAADTVLLPPAEQKIIDGARALGRTEQLLKKQVDWKEKDASLGQVAEHLGTLMGEGAPSIEVRTKSAVNSTFELPKAPVGATLVSLAKLANSKVWVFADGLVIAPESALTEEEALAVKRREGGDWTRSQALSGSSAGWSGREMENRVVLRLIAADVKEKLAAKGQTEPAPLPQAPPPPAPGAVRTPPELYAPFELAFGEMSPMAQQLLLDLVKTQSGNFGGGAAKDAPALTIASEAIVGVDDTQKGRLNLFVRGTALPSWQTRWNINL